MRLLWQTSGAPPKRHSRSLGHIPHYASPDFRPLFLSFIFDTRVCAYDKHSYIYIYILPLCIMHRILARFDIAGVLDRRRHHHQSKFYFLSLRRTYIARFNLIREKDEVAADRYLSLSFRIQKGYSMYTVKARVIHSSYWP